MIFVTHQYFPLHDYGYRKMKICLILPIGETKPMKTQRITENFSSRKKWLAKDKEVVKCNR